MYTPLNHIDCGYSCVPTIYVLSKNKKNINFFSTENFHFITTLKISVYCMGKFSFRNVYQFLIACIIKVYVKFRVKDVFCENKINFNML